MPTYKKDISHIVTETEANEMMASVSPLNTRDRFLLALFYLTGARPVELRQLRRKDFMTTVEGYNVTIPTAKLGTTTDFRISTRTLPLRKDMPYFLEIERHLINFREDDLVLPISVTHMWRLVDAASKKQCCPYNFRHSRLTKLARQGANIADLMAWKGARDTRSVGAYLAAKPYDGQFKVD